LLEVSVCPGRYRCPCPCTDLTWLDLTPDLTFERGREIRGWMHDLACTQIRKRKRKSRALLNTSPLFCSPGSPMVVDNEPAPSLLSSLLSLSSFLILFIYPRLLCPSSFSARHSTAPPSHFSCRITHPILLACISVTAPCTRLRPWPPSGPSPRCGSLSPRPPSTLLASSRHRPLLLQALLAPPVDWPLFAMECLVLSSNTHRTGLAVLCPTTLLA